MLYDKTIAETNREAWNEASAYHQKARANALIEGFANPEFTTFDRDCDKALVEKLQGLIDLDGKAVAQLQCNNGSELLSLMRLGAQSAVGFDISDAAIAEARELAAIAQLDARFERTDILEIGHEYDDSFDLVFISEGSLQWFSDLGEYFSVVARLLKPGGLVFIHEIHPFAYFFEQGFDPNIDTDFSKMPSYFDAGPYNYDDGLDYVGETKYAGKPCSWFLHTMSEIITAMLANRIQISEFEEYNTEVTNNATARLLDKFPLSYLLVGNKR
jgi:SAM-dependent methyltransferase